MALWTPANLTTAPVDWFKGDAGVTGSPVSALSNFGSNLGLSQGTAGNRPTITGTLNSLPVLGFNGSNVILQSTGNNSYAAGPYHVFIVQKRNTTARYDNYFRVGTTWSSTMGMSCQWRADSDAFEFFGNGFGPIYIGDSTGPAGSIYSTPEKSDGNWHIMEVRFTSSPAVWFNANSRSLNESYTGFNVQSMTAPLILGNDNNTGSNEGILGSIAEFILLNYTPSSTDQEKIQGYLAWKWGNTGTTATNIVSRLPAGHTYKSAAPTTGGISVSATGSAASSAIGSVSIVGKATVTLTGNVATTAIGTATAVPKTLVNVSGSLAATAINSVSFVTHNHLSVTGNALAATVNSVALATNNNLSVTGFGLTTAINDVTAFDIQNVAVTGELLTADYGIVDVETTSGIVNVSVLLSGSELLPTIGTAFVPFWTPVPTTSGNWTPVPTGSNNWTPVPDANNEWKPVDA